MKKQSKNYSNLFSGDIDISLKTAANLLATYPESARAFAEIGKGLKSAGMRREALAKTGLDVPPLLIVSTTDTCNLSCKGCYACDKQGKNGDELSGERIAELLDEASELGVCIVMLAGGEPLLSHGWLDALGTHTDMAGIVFTNGTLLDKTQREWFARNRHVIPTFSIEGGESLTDERRGIGVYETVTAAMNALQKEGVPFGISVTMTSRNIDDNLHRTFIEQYLRMGCRLFIFVEYVPVDPGSEPLVLSKMEKKHLNEISQKLAKKYPALFIPFPGDEEQYGGCLAAGRGFVYINTDGSVEPCPFAPFSDVSVKDSTLKEALMSDFLAKVRENHHLLKEGDGGCALWHNRQWLEDMLSIKH